MKTGSKRLRRNVMHAVVGLVGVGLGASPAAAQGGGYSQVTSGQCPGVYPVVSGTSSVALSCTGPGDAFFGSASSVAGKASAYASATSVPGAEPYTFSSTLTEESGATWGESMKFSASSIVPKTVRLSLLFQGELRGVAGPLYPDAAGAQAGINVSATPVWGSAPVGTGTSFITSALTGSTVDKLFATALTLDVPIADGDFGRAGFTFFYNVYTSASVYRPYDNSYSGFASGNVTLAAFTGFDFLDADGRTISDGVDYQLLQGTEVVSATPEPATLVLFGTGFLGVGVLSRGRRRR